MPIKLNLNYFSQNTAAISLGHGGKLRDSQPVTSPRVSECCCDVAAQCQVIDGKSIIPIQGSQTSQKKKRGRKNARDKGRD